MDVRAAEWRDCRDSPTAEWELTFEAEKRRGWYFRSNRDQEHSRENASVEQFVSMSWCFCRPYVQQYQYSIENKISMHQMDRIQLAKVCRDTAGRQTRSSSILQSQRSSIKAKESAKSTSAILQMIRNIVVPIIPQLMETHQHIHADAFSSILKH